MNKYLFFFIIILTFTGCSLRSVVKHHGVHFLEKKQEKLILNKSNKNDIRSLLGMPSTISSFDNDLWIYIERKTNHTTLRKFGREEIIANNVLLLEINNFGLLEKKEFINLEKMNKVKFSKNDTTSDYKKNTFIYNFLSSMRQKINDPLGKRKKK
jgi:outer membrane protein assembly factor BamE (lipoprotein component of BamABCDE complex)